MKGIFPHRTLKKVDKNSKYDSELSPAMQWQAAVIGNQAKKTPDANAPINARIMNAAVALNQSEAQDEFQCKVPGEHQRRNTEYFVISREAIQLTTQCIKPRRT